MKRNMIYFLVTFSILLAACGSGSSEESSKPIEESGYATANDYGITDEQLKKIRDYYGNGWYGWFWVSDATGEYEHISSTASDVCAYFDFDAGPEGSPVALVGIYQYDDRNTMIASLTVQFGSDDSWSIGGANVLGADLEVEDKMMHYYVEDYKDLLVLQGTMNHNEGTLSFLCTLRPWGKTWDDIANAVPDNMPQYYDDWYKPLIESGSGIPMS